MTPGGGRAKLQGGRRILVLAIVVSLSVTAVLAIGTLLFGDFGEREGRILTTTALLAGYGLLALPAGFLLDQRRLPRLAATLLVLASAGFGIAIASVWMSEPPAALPKSMGTVTAFAIASTQIAALAARRRDNDPALVRRLYPASTATALVLAAMITAAAWAEIDSSGYYRILAALTVLDVLLVALQPILAMARPAGAVFRLRIRVEPGDMIETTVEAADLASAAARAIQEIERDGRQVTGLERIGRSDSPATRLGAHANTLSPASGDGPMQVRDLMTAEVIIIGPEASLHDAAKRLIEHDISGMPVVDKHGRVIGVVSESDIVIKERRAEPRGRLVSLLFELPDEAARRRDAMTVDQAMSSPAIVIDANRSVSEAAARMLDEGVHRLPVLDDGRLVGMLTRSDLLRAFARTDTEIEHEIREDVLRRSLWISPEDVQVSVDHGAVILRGNVQTESEAELVRAFVSKVPGVVSLEAHLTWAAQEATEVNR